MSQLRTLSLTLVSTALALMPVLHAQAADSPKASAAISAAVDSSSRSADDKERDEFRHPKQALEFWGLQPGMTILEVQPGGGYWTEILAPFARATGGQYHATAADLDNAETSEGARKGRADFEAKMAAKPDVYGKVKLVNWGAKSAPPPANSFDFILAGRTVHGWLGNNMAEKAFKDLATGLKPGGILAIEQHRAKAGSPDSSASSGYVTEARVIGLAKKAGLELAGRSEVNANPKDTADHPFGVWTLPPVRRSPDKADPSFDRAKYDAIGESDRMTLKFVKPK